MMPAWGETEYFGQKSEAFSIVQMSCGLYVPKFGNDKRRARFEELTKTDIIAIGLRRSFDVTGEKEFVLANIEELRGGLPAPPDPLPHT